MKPRIARIGPELLDLQSVIFFGSFTSRAVFSWPILVQINGIRNNILDTLPCGCSAEKCLSCVLCLCLLLLTPYSNVYLAEAQMRTLRPVRFLTQK